MDAEMTRADAYEYLELPIGADPDSIRTSYKRLALKWLPEKHCNSSEAMKNFSNVSLAFKRLTSDSPSVSLTYHQMYDQCRQVVCRRNSFANGLNSTDDESDCDDDDDDDDVSCNHIMTNGRKLTPEEIEKNANDLLTEEEREKKKAEKRRAKKKRRREKKRLEKQESNKKDDEKNKQKESIQGKQKKESKHKESDPEEAGFDEKSAFFTHVINKKKKGTAPEATPVPKSKPPGAEAKGQANEISDETAEKIRHFAISGYQKANEGHYQPAINLFSEAISLDPSDHRFFGNRSYCYDRLQQYDKALKDAAIAIELKPDWPKGYFRKGRALAGLKQYNEADQAFIQVLKLDPSCEDAATELKRVRILMLYEMGFTQQQAEDALASHDTVQQALDSLLAHGDGYIDREAVINQVAEIPLSDEVYVSDDEDYTTTSHTVVHQPAVSVPRSAPPIPAIATASPSDIKMDPRNPEGLTALWVGNVLPEVTSKQLETMFGKHGAVTSVRCLPDKYCAFVNFKNKESASRAITALQGVSCAGQKLLIKFPDNPVHAANNNNIILKRPTTTVNKNISGQERSSGPVNGDECYFWRTTGCQFGKTCHYRHVPEHKGVDRKPWQH